MKRFIFAPLGLQLWKSTAVGVQIGRRGVAVAGEDIPQRQRFAAPIKEAGVTTA
jgi:hypothetical protein